MDEIIQEKNNEIAEAVETTEEPLAETIEATEEPVEPAVKKRKKVSVKKALAIAYGVILLALGGSIAAFSMMPYEITIDGERICVVESREDASDAIAKALSGSAVEGTRITSIKCEKKIEVNRLNTLSKADVKSVKAAAASISEVFASDAEEHGDQKILTVTSAKVAEKKFTPDPEYIKDDSLPAGSTVITDEGEDGRGEYLYTYTSINGNVDDRDEELIKVLDEGRSAQIVKGTVGLPDGEDWKTYEGDPIFSSGSALVATAKKYKGAPYKWGGTNLKKGVSCIGFVKAIYAKYGIKIPMSHPLLKKFGVGIKYENAQPGDIICYKEHTGIYVGGGKMIDAASNRGVGIARVRPGMVVTVRRVPRS